MNFFRILIFAIIFLLSQVSAFSQNYLNTIQIDSNEGGNQITLKTINGVEVVKEVKNDNLIVLELKNIKADQKLSTIYNNVLHVKNVIVKEPAKNNLQIIIEGENIANTGIVVLPSEIKSNNSKNIVLDKPINEYEPIIPFNEKINLSNNNTFFEYLNTNFQLNKRKITYLKHLIKNNFDNLNLDFIFYAIVFFLVILAGNKFINKENEKDIKGIGLSQSLKNKRSYDITINDKTIPTLRSLKSTSNNNSEIISRQYGMNEYKKSEKNPYSNTTAQDKLTKQQIPDELSKRINKNEIVIPKKDIKTTNLKSSQKALNKAALSSSASYNQKQQKIASKPYITNSERNIDIIDGQKFLDSMTKIYEQSGRKDLALNIKRVSQVKKNKKL